jgi:hypothetical protein
MLQRIESRLNPDDIPPIPAQDTFQGLPRGILGKTILEIMEAAGEVTTSGIADEIQARFQLEFLIEKERSDWRHNSVGKQLRLYLKSGLIERIRVPSTNGEVVRWRCKSDAVPSSDHLREQAAAAPARLLVHAVQFLERQAHRLPGHVPFEDPAKTGLVRWLYHQRRPPIPFVSNTEPMRRRRYSRVLVVFLCVLTLVMVFLYVESPFRARNSPAMTNRARSIARPVVVSAEAHQPKSSPDFDPRIDKPPQSFSHRLRCTAYHRQFGHLLAPEPLSLLCDRKPLEAVKMLSSMAEAGDEHARTALALRRTIRFSG